MPIHEGLEQNLHFYQFGTRGKKYYFFPYDSWGRLRAYQLCLQQARAIEWRKHLSYR